MSSSLVVTAAVSRQPVSGALPRGRALGCRTRASTHSSTSSRRLFLVRSKLQDFVVTGNDTATRGASKKFTPLISRRSARFARPLAPRAKNDDDNADENLMEKKERGEDLFLLFYTKVDYHLHACLIKYLIERPAPLRALRDEHERGQHVRR